MSTIALDARRQGTVIDYGMANGFNAARGLQGRSANKNATTGRAGGGAARVGDPGRRIELEEEKDECGNEQLFRQSLTVQLHHE